MMRKLIVVLLGCICGCGNLEAGGAFTLGHILSGAIADEGIDGPMGEIGLQGEQGIQGIQGETGEQGDRGFAGIDGASGPIGERGLRGESGETIIINECQGNCGHHHHNHN